MTSKFTLDKDSHTELRHLLEDTIEYWCDQNMVSGELAWLVTQCLATAKVEQLRGNIR